MAAKTLCSYRCPRFLEIDKRFFHQTENETEKKATSHFFPISTWARLRIGQSRKLWVFRNLLDRFWWKYKFLVTFGHFFNWDNRMNKNKKLKKNRIFTNFSLSAQRFCYIALLSSESIEQFFRNRQFSTLSDHSTVHRTKSEKMACKIFPPFLSLLDGKKRFSISKMIRQLLHKVCVVLWRNHNNFKFFSTKIRRHDSRVPSLAASVAPRLLAKINTANLCVNISPTLENAPDLASCAKKHVKFAARNLP